MGGLAQIHGAARTPFGVLDGSLREILASVALEALDDSGTELREVDAIFVANFVGGPTLSQLHLNSMIASSLSVDVPALRVEAACASGGAALWNAILALERFRTVLVVGVEVMSRCDPGMLTEAISMAGDITLEYAEGLVFPGTYALIAQAYMDRYGVDSEVLARVAVKNHRNAALNPLAHFHSKTVTVEQALTSPLVAEPLRRYDCCPVSDGAVALVVGRGAASDRSVSILGSSLRTGNLALCESEDITSFPAARAAAAEALAQASVEAKDLDLVEIHDCFTIAELIGLEDIGVADPGRAGDLLLAGELDIGGACPSNTDGGLKADGHPIGATGLAQVYEAVTQIRGEAGERQVSGARLALTHNIGGVGGTAAVHVLGRSS